MFNERLLRASRRSRDGNIMMVRFVGLNEGMNCSTLDRSVGYEVSRMGDLHDPTGWFTNESYRHMVSVSQEIRY